MGPHSDFSVLHEDHLPQLWEVIQPVGNQEHHLVLGIVLQMGEHHVLGAAVQRREGVVKHQHRPGMGKGAGQRQPLGLPAGQAGAAAADNGIGSVFHRRHLPLQRRSGQIRRSVLSLTAEDVIANGIGAELRAWCQSRYDWVFPVEELAFSPGVIPALYQIVEDLVKPDHGKVLTMTPAYGFFLHACEYNGVELVTSPLRKVEGRFEMGWEDFRRKVTDPDVRVLMLCNPHNPNGRIWTEEELRRMAEIIGQNRLRVVSDEIHCDLNPTGLRRIPMGKVMQDYERLITCISTSKTFNLAGLLLHSNIIIRSAQERARFQARDKNIGAVWWTESSSTYSSLLW